MNIQIESRDLSVLVNHLGAEISSVKNRKFLEYIWRADKNIWPRHSPVLFPIVGKLKNNSFHYQSEEFSMTQHGFARDLQFALVQHETSSCTFELRSTAETKKQYPFEFLFQIAYRLKNNTLETNYRVVNLSETPMFFSVGAHPGFNCPLLPSESFEDYYFEFETSSLEVCELENGLRLANKRTLSIPNKKLFLSDSLFNNDALVFEGGQISSIKLCSSKSQHSIQLDCATWPYFGLWSKKSCRQFVCMEPWHGIADSISAERDFTKKEGLINLLPQEEYFCDYSLRFL